MDSSPSQTQILGSTMEMLSLSVLDLPLEHPLRYLVQEIADCSEAMSGLSHDLIQLLCILLQDIGDIVADRESFTACLDFCRPIGTFQHRLGRIEKHDIATFRTHETAHDWQLLLQAADT